MSYKSETKCVGLSENLLNWDIEHNVFFVFTDFDGDEYIGKDDLVHTINALTRQELSQNEIDFITDKVRQNVQANNNLLDNMWYLFVHKSMDAHSTIQYK